MSSRSAASNPKSTAPRDDKQILFEAYFNRGSAYAQKGEFRRALDDYNRAIELKPKEHQAYYNRGVAFMEIGNPERAINDYTTAIQLKGTFSEGL